MITIPADAPGHVKGALVLSTCITCNAGPTGPCAGAPFGSYHDARVAAAILEGRLAQSDAEILYEAGGRAVDLPIPVQFAVNHRELAGALR